MSIPLNSVRSVSFYMLVTQVHFHVTLHLPKKNYFLPSSGCIVLLDVIEKRDNKTSVCNIRRSFRSIKIKKCCCSRGETLTGLKTTCSHDLFRTHNQSW